MEEWDGGIQEEPGRLPTNALSSSLAHPSQGRKKKSVRFNNAVTVKVVPRISQYL
jgi:hypothetical protein